MITIHVYNGKVQSEECNWGIMYILGHQQCNKTQHTHEHAYNIILCECKMTTNSLSDISEYKLHLKKRKQIWCLKVRPTFWKMQYVCVAGFILSHECCERVEIPWFFIKNLLKAAIETVYTQLHTHFVVLKYIEIAPQIIRARHCVWNAFNFQLLLLGCWLWQ